MIKVSEFPLFFVFVCYQLNIMIRHGCMYVKNDKMMLMPLFIHRRHTIIPILISFINTFAAISSTQATNTSFSIN